MRQLLALIAVCWAVGLLQQVEAASKKAQPCCPLFWTLRGSRCYRFVGKSLNWHNAQSYCNGLDHKANLVSVNTEGEGAFLQHFFAEKGGGVYKDFWTGLSDTAEEGHYSWVGINRPMTYSNWYFDQPDNYGHSQDCVKVITLTGYWNDVRCTDRAPFICERPRPGS